MSDDNYADYPKSITEIRADKKGGNNADDWTVRDALIAALRALDKGDVKASSILILMVNFDANGEGVDDSNYFIKSANNLETLGILARATNRYCHI